MKRLGALAVVVGLCGGLVACSKITDQAKTEVLSAIDATARLSRAYTVTDAAGGHTTSVRTVVADDLRYAMDAQVDGAAVADEVVADDSRALRVADPALLQSLIGASAPAPPTPTPIAAPSPSAQASAGPAATAAPGTGATPAIPGDLNAGRWVVDVHGANSLAAIAQDTYRPGSDPLYDALELLPHIRSVVEAGAGVTVYNPDDTGYRRDLDPFPAPGAGVVRYDVTPPDLQPNDPTLGHPQPPGAATMRRASVYVSAGRVVEFRETVSVANALSDPRLHIAARIGDYGIPIPAQLSAADQAASLLQAVNRRLPPTQQIREHTMRATFTGLGAPQRVTLPDGAVPGDLTRVGFHGLTLYEGA